MSRASFETDPLCCPKCSGKIKILNFIEDPEVIKKILKHLGLWDIKASLSPSRRLIRARGRPVGFRLVEPTARRD